MGLITLEDIRLRDYTLESLPRIGNLRETCLNARPEICIERARHVTRYLGDQSSDEEPAQTRYAGAISHFLSMKEPLFPDDSLLAGTTTSKFFGAPVYPELTGMTIWPELDTIGTREKNPLKLSREDAEELNFEIFPYWMERNVLEYARKKYGNPECMKLFERLVFFIAGKAGAISHTVPCYRLGLEKGLESIISETAVREAEIVDAPGCGEKRDFYRAVRSTLRGVINYAGRLSARAAELASSEAEPGVARNLLELSEVCARVPAKPARSFREAVNALWIMQVAVHAESINMAISPGRLDQILYPYYRNDMENGNLTAGEALELVACLWLKLNDNTNLVPEASQELFGGAGTAPAVTLGGVDGDGRDAVNDLTYIMLRVAELLKTRDPNLNARYHYVENPPQYRDRVAEVVAETHSIPAFHNDVADIRVLANQGIETRHARDYAVIGCVELASAGRSYDASSSIIFNLVSALELALFNGARPVTGNVRTGPATGEPEEFKNFDEFLNAFEKQLEFLIGEAILLNEYLGRVHQEILPTPLLSALFEGPMEKGIDLIRGGAVYNSSGATHIGFADTVDSLNAIENAVFVERRCSFAELLEALRADFSGHEKLHAWLVNRTPKYGTDDTAALRNSRYLTRFLYDFYQGHTNYRGGKYRPAYWTMTNHAGQGKLSGALPSGRKAHRPFASGITPVSQAASDLAACLESVAGLDGLCIPGGEAFNLKYPSIANEDDLRKFCGAVDAYFRAGGLHIQFNIMSYETLLDAKLNPGKHPELLVRVSGYSAYFNDLNDAMKDEIITRTAYDLGNGKAVPLPTDFGVASPSS